MKMNFIGKYMPLIFKLSTICFSVAYVVDGIGYLLKKEIFLLWGNLAGLILISTLYLIYKSGIITLERSLFIHIVIVTLNLYYSMLYEAYLGEEGSLLHLSEAICICTIPSMLAGITTKKMWMPTIIGLGAIACYIVAGIAMGNPEDMLMHVPAFFIVIVGFGISYSIILKLIQAIEERNAQAQEEQKNIERIINLTPKQWELIRQGRMSRKRMESLLIKTSKEYKEKLIYQAKELVQSDEEIKQAIREVHSGLTSGDLELCTLIVRGKSVTEIAKLQNIKIHSVTARRSRLRAKLGIAKGENLNDYLISLARKRA